MTPSVNLIPRNFDSYIGRAAHIRFLESQTLFQMLAARLEEVFD